MLKIWGKLWVRDKVVKSYTVENIQRTGSLEDCVKSALPKIIGEFDLPMPIFLPSNREDIERFGQTRFTADHFVESFPYQSLEIEIMETE